MALSQDSIARAALEVLELTGLDALTLRAIAGHLSIKAPTLYWHFKNKRAVVDAMATCVMSDWIARDFVEDPEESWQHLAFGFALGMRRTLLNHRDGALMIAGSTLGGAAWLGAREIVLRSFGGHAIPPPEAALCVTTIYNYVIGFTIEEQAALVGGFSNPTVDEARIDAQRYPLSHGLGVELFESHDDRFKRGISMIVDGFAASHRRPA